MSTTGTLRGDMPVGGWIDRYVPVRARPYLKLMRLDRPIGTWLLLFPCWWSTALAADGLPNLWYMALFALGAAIMRGAGCTINDIADRDFDGRVARTAGRPLPSGEITLRQALLFLGLQLAMGFLVLAQFNGFAIALGLAAMLLVVPYPFMKRITYWPQAWLGLTFNWGALLGWAAVTGSLAEPALMLYVGGLFWTLGYDTIYGHQDKEDDILIGVKSASLALGERTRPWVGVFYVMALAMFAVAGTLAKLSWPFYPLLLVAGLHLAWQVRTLDIDDGPNCLKRFKSNRHFGWLVLAAILAGQTL